MWLIELAFLTIFWTWIACAVLLWRLSLIRANAQPAPGGALVWEPVALRASDGHPLGAWRLRVPDANAPWVILCEGPERPGQRLADLAATLQGSGLHVLWLGFRTQSPGRRRMSSFGLREQLDVEGALVWLGRQADVSARPYGVYGRAMGATAALLVAARDERIGALIAEDPAPSIQAELARRLHAAGFPGQPFGWFLAAAYRLRFGAWPVRIRPMVCAEASQARALRVAHEPVEPAAVSQFFTQALQRSITRRADDRAQTARAAG